MLSIVTVYNYAAFLLADRCVRRLGEAGQDDRSKRGKASIIVVQDMPSGVIPGTMRWVSSMENSCVGGALAKIGLVPAQIAE